MIDSKFVTATFKTTVSTLLIGGVCLYSSSAVARTIFTPNYIAQQSDEVVERNRIQRSDGTGEQITNPDLESTINQPPERTKKINLMSYSSSLDRLTDSSSSDWEVQSASQDWFNLNRGDGSSDLVRIVIWRF